MITLKFNVVSEESFVKAVDAIFDGKQTKNIAEITANKFVVDAYTLKMRSKVVASISLYSSKKGMTVFANGLSEEQEAALDNMLS